MAAPPDTPLRFGLVGTGPEVVEAIEALRNMPGVEIAVVADASDRSEGARLAQRLGLPLEKNWMGVFRTDANVVLELNGDDRQYERLLSIKPPGVEVMSVRGARLLIGLLKQVAGGIPAAGTPAPSEPVRPETPHWIGPLMAALRAALGKGGRPEDAAATLLPALVTAGGMDFAAIALPAGAGFTWFSPPGHREALSKIPADRLGQALAATEPVWLARPAKGLGMAGLLPLRIGTETLGLFAVGRSQSVSAAPGELEALRLGAELLASTLRATQPPPAGGEVVIKEVVKEVVKEVPVEVVKEVVKEVVREVPVEVPVEVVREVPRGDEDEVRRLRRRVEELQAAHEQLAAMSGQIPLVDEKMQALINMASGVGHVFNNVLAGVLGRTQLLLQQARRERARDLVAGLTEIEHATLAGITALTRIQEFSRARAVEAPRPVDLNDVVQQAVEQTRPKWRDEPAAKGVRIEVITHFGSPAPVSGVEGELQEAVVQLIANAVDAMPGGGTITVRTGGEPGRGLVAVSDTGVGMSESVRRRAFEPFFSAKGETGLGLGLSVVHGIMARHGGDASIESEPGKGTTVTLRVPTAGEGVPAEGAIPEEERAQVLVVDDDAGVRAALADILRGAGYAVTVAPSGLEGIAKVRARQGPFDLIITDLAMPDVSGWEVVEAVKKAEAATPVVIMSGFDQARATRRAKELGVDLVLTKPFDMQAFLNTVRGLLAGRKRL